MAKNAKANAQIREWRAQNKDKVKLINFKNKLKRNYGLSLEQYNAMFTQQNGCCAICSRPAAEFKRNLSVDHSHVDGNIRGLLCGPCNVLLGMAEESIQRLQKAILYLKAHSRG